MVFPGAKQKQSSQHFHFIKKQKALQQFYAQKIEVQAQ